MQQPISAQLEQNLGRVCSRFDAAASNRNPNKGAFRRRWASASCKPSGLSCHYYLLTLQPFSKLSSTFDRNSPRNVRRSDRRSLNAGAKGNRGVAVDWTFSRLVLVRKRRNVRLWIITLR